MHFFYNKQTHIYLKSFEYNYIKYQKKAEESGGAVGQENTFGQQQNTGKRIDNKPKKKQGGCC